VIVQTPPLDVKEQVGLRLGQRPGFAGQRGNGLAQRQINTLDKTGLNAMRQAMGGLTGGQVSAFAPEHAHCRKDDLPPFATFDKLAVQQLVVHLTLRSTCAWRLLPMAEVGGQRIKIGSQAVRGEGRDTVVASRCFRSWTRA